MGCLMCTPRHPTDRESTICLICRQVIPPGDSRLHRSACFNLLQQRQNTGSSGLHKTDYDALPNSDLYTCRLCACPLKVMTCSSMTEAQGVCLKCWQQDVVQKEVLATPDNTARAKAELRYGKNTVHYCFVCNKSLCHFHGNGAMDLTDVDSIPRNNTDLPMHLS